jgi:hypothetical protein
MTSTGVVVFGSVAMVAGASGISPSRSADMGSDTVFQFDGAGAAATGIMRQRSSARLKALAATLSSQLVSDQHRLPLLIPCCRCPGGSL